ncbi:hypothetical protein Emag_005867 [Eimeria magna]
MSSDDFEKLEPDEFLMSLAAEPSILHEDPPHQVESAPVPESSVDPAAEDSPEEDELGFPLKEVPGRCPYAWSPPRRKHDRFGFYTAYLDLHLPYCMVRDREEEEQILEDYDRRWFAFDPLCSEYPRRGKVNHWRDDPYYHDPSMIMVTEMTMERPQIARDLRVRFPYEVQYYPDSKAFAHFGIRAGRYHNEFRYAGDSYRRWFADPCPP